MRRNEPGDNKVRHALPMVHPNAAAIDVGARMHVAAASAQLRRLHDRFTPFSGLVRRMRR
jgi:hypothetical protein